MGGGVGGAAASARNDAKRTDGEAPNPNEQQNIPGKRNANAKPVLNPHFEERPVYLMKSGIQKEMEAMINKRAPLEERNKALKKLRVQWHPDKNPEDPEVAKSIFQFIEESKGWFLDGAE